MEEKKTTEQVSANELTETKNRKREYIKKGATVAGMAAIGLGSFEMGKAQGIVDEEAINDDTSHATVVVHDNGNKPQDEDTTDAVTIDDDNLDEEDIEVIAVAEPETSPETEYEPIDIQIDKDVVNVSNNETDVPISEVDDDLICDETEVSGINGFADVNNIADDDIPSCIQDDLMA